MLLLLLLFLFLFLFLFLSVPVSVLIPVLVLVPVPCVIVKFNKLREYIHDFGLGGTSNLNLRQLISLIVILLHLR